MHSAVRRRLRGVLPCVAAGLMTFGVVACGGDNNNNSGSSGSSPAAADTTAAADGGRRPRPLTTAKKVLDVGIKGRLTAPPTTPNPGQEGRQRLDPRVLRRVAVGEHPGEDRGRGPRPTLGWKIDDLRRQGRPRRLRQGRQQAIANGANGIVLVAIDCSYVKNQLAQAKAEEHRGLRGLRLRLRRHEPRPRGHVHGRPELRRPVAQPHQAWNQWGADTAAWIVANTNGEAKPLILRTDQIAVLRAWQDGFDAEMKKCPKCETINQPWNTVTDITPAAIASLMKNAALQHPEINSSAFGSTVTSGYNQGILAMGEKGKSLKVMAGLGLPDEFALMARAGQRSERHHRVAAGVDRLRRHRLDQPPTSTGSSPRTRASASRSWTTRTSKRGRPPARTVQGDDELPRRLQQALGRRRGLRVSERPSRARGTRGRSWPSATSPSGSAPPGPSKAWSWSSAPARSTPSSGATGAASRR